MSDTASLVFDIDYAQTRVKYDSQSILAEGSYDGYRSERVTGWDFALSTNAWQEPITWTTFPLPNIFDSSWNTTTSGNYARYSLASFTFTNSSKWKTDDKALTGDNWLSADNLTSDETMILTSALPTNTPIWIATYSFNAESQKFIEFEAGWSNGGSLSTGVGIRRYSDGSYEVYKDGELVGTYKVGSAQGEGKTTQQFSGVALLPCRKRELIVVTRGLAGFSHAFSDLDDETDDQTITPAEKFWIKFPVVGSGPRSVQVQVAKIVPASSMTLYSRVLQFADKPQSTQTTQTRRVFGSKYSATFTSSIVNESGSSAFVPDGILNKARMKIEVTGVTKMTGIYGAVATLNGVLTNTPEESYNLAPYVDSFSCRVPESGAPTEATLNLVRLEEIRNLGEKSDDWILGLKTQSNRPMKISFGDQILIGGRTGNPKSTLGYDDSVTTIEIEIFDRWRALEQYIFRDKIPLYGINEGTALPFTFKDALVYVISAVLTDDPSRYDIDALAESFEIPEGGSPSTGDFGFCIQPGDRASEVIERLFQTFAPDWFYGFVPDTGMTIFKAVSPGNLSSTPEITLWTTQAGAVAQLEAEGFSNEQSIKISAGRTCLTYRQEVLPVEATEVRVTGFNPRTNLPIQAFYRDSTLEDPELAVDDRPAGWVGEKLVYGYADPAIQTQAILEEATDRLANRLTVPRIMAEWTCNFLFKSDLVTPMWKGDCLTIEGIGDFRITSIQFSAVKDYSDENDLGAWVYRPATYTGELINGTRDGWRAGTRAFGLSGIRLANERNRIARSRAVRGGEQLLMVAGILATQRP